MRICCNHCCISSLAASYVIPIFKFFLTSDLRLRINIHANIKTPSLLKKLETFGLHRNSLPKTIGGNYDEKSAWIDECNRTLEKKSRRMKRQRQDHL